MKPKTLVILTVIVGVLGAVLWLWERDLPSSDQQRGELAKRILSADAEDVTALTIERDGVSTRFERWPVDEEASPGGRQWRLVEPIEGRADSRAVDRWVESLVALEKRRTLEEPVRSELGLDAPRTTISLDTEEFSTTLEIGADVPASDNVIIAVAGQDDAFVVGRSFLTETERTPSAWRDPEMFTGRRDRVEQIEVATASGTGLSFVRRDDAWWLEAPIEDRANGDRVDRLLGDLVGLRAQEFIGESPDATAATWFAPPTATIEVSFGEGEPEWRLELAAVPSDEPRTTYGRIEEPSGPLTFVADLDLARFDDEVAIWRSPSWTEWQSFQVDSLRVIDSTGTLTVTRNGSDWSRDGEPIYFTSVSDLIAAVTATEAERFIDAEVPAGEPILTLVLSNAAGEIETLSLHPSEGGEALASSSSRPDVLLVLGQETVTSVRDAVEAIRNATVKPES